MEHTRFCPNTFFCLSLSGDSFFFFPFAFMDFIAQLINLKNKIEKIS